MNVEQEKSRSLWMERPAPELSRLTASTEADVLVIGAGIAGLATAYALCKEGRRVLVVDRGRFGRGMTARTTAHLAFDLDDYFQELIAGHGDEAARLWYRSQSAAVDYIESICEREHIDCDFARVDGVLMAATDEDIAYLEKELEAARRAGFTDAEWLNADPTARLERPAIRFPRQARFHPLKFLDCLIDCLDRLGARLHDNTAIASVEDAEGGVIATTSSGVTIRARQALVATNSPFHLRIPIHTKQAPYRTYAIAAPVPRGSVPDILFWDTVEPGYHYVRLQPGDTEDMLIVGGEDHKTGTEDAGQAHIERLEGWARTRYPMMGSVAYAWSGQVQEPADHVGFIGRSPDRQHVFVVTGDSGQGITTGCAAALILRDVMNGRDNPWAELYAPGRVLRRGLSQYVKENVEAARHWLETAAPGELDDPEKLWRGQGAVVKIEGKPVAAWRDDAGALHLRSAICTHAGCEVHWNGFERCWDCPCHGSQFSVDGQVLNGPAFEPLGDPPSAGSED